VGGTGRWLLVGLGVVALGGAFAIGRLTAPEATPGDSERSSTLAHRRPVGPTIRSEATGSDRADWSGPLPGDPLPGSPAAPLSTPAAASGAAPPTPELVAATTAEARQRLEDLRPYITSHCWPSGGLKNGRTKADLRIDLTFDKDGHEIARGIQENRRSPAGEFTACLRKLEGTRLAVAAPGRSVGVVVPFSVP
jgi:hypothetical protein